MRIKRLRLRGAAPQIWTLADIQRLPEFGIEHGWFYGLVRNHETGKVRLCEILPGMGYVSAWPLDSPRSWWWALRDVFRQHPIRESVFSVLSNAAVSATTFRIDPTATETNQHAYAPPSAAPVAAARPPIDRESEAVRDVSGEGER